MKLLIVAVDGTEPDYKAMKFFVETLGIPYQSAFMLDTTKKPPQPRPLPALENGTKGFFQGIVLTNGNGGYCDSTGCYTGLDAGQWAALEKYAGDYSVRIASSFTFPEPRYGLTRPTTGQTEVATTDAAPLNATFTGPAAGLFPYLNTANSVRIANSYVYFGRAAAAQGETTTPFLVAGDNVLGVLHTSSDGKEYMALTMANNPDLRHSLVLNYGILNWVMNGVFIGGRKVFLTPQVDDHFIPDDLFVKNQGACMPSAVTNEPTYDPQGACPTVRITGQDFKSLADWQSRVQQNPQFQRFRVTHAFNGVGTVDETGKTLFNDDLVQQSITLRGKFFWVNHTWDHENLDCYNAVANSRVCRPATEQESKDEIAKNVAQAKVLGLPLDSISMVTPGISGLTNINFLTAAQKAKIRYLVSDTSKQGLPAVPNTPMYTANGLVLIPRRPTNIFYNTMTGEPNKPGSLPDEYNYFYGPGGLFLDANKNPFFSTEQSYTQILNTEAENLVTYMLRNEVYPQMYHQSNLHFFNGSQSLFTDLHDAALQKFSAISKLPVVSMTQADLGRELEAKAAVINAKVSGVLIPGKSVTLSGANAANVPVTGICFGTACESYGGQCVSKVPVPAAKTAVINFTSATSACAVNPGPSDIPAPPAPAIPPSKPNSQQQNVAGAQQTVKTLLQLTTLTDADINRLESIADDLTDALDTAVWKNGDYLNPDEGQQVFDSLKGVAQKLMAMLKDGKSQVADSTATQLLVAITDVSRILANASIGQARTMAPSSKDLVTATNQLSAAESAAGAAKYDAAIDSFKKAWQAAEKAIDSVDN